jgi:RNA polymerase sigma factor (TIGR02999 family)
MSNAAQITLLLQRWQHGDGEALEDMLPVVYQKLQQLAAAQLRRDAGATIQPTELVAEAYLRLVDIDAVDWRGRAHFYSLAARVMRRVLVERYRRRQAARRGGGITLLTLDAEQAGPERSTLQLDQLEQALLQLERLDPRQAEIVTLKFFGGLTALEIGSALALSETTVKREWAAARIWLFDALNPDHA